MANGLRRFTFNFVVGLVVCADKYAARRTAYNFALYNLYGNTKKGRGIKECGIHIIMEGLSMKHGAIL